MAPERVARLWVGEQLVELIDGVLYVSVPNYGIGGRVAVEVV